MACIYHIFFYVLPRASYSYIWYEFIPSVLWRFSNKFSSFFRCRKLAFTSETSYIFVFILGVVGRYVGWLSGIWECLAVCQYVQVICLYVCMAKYIHTLEHAPIHPENIHEGCLSCISMSVSISICPKVLSVYPFVQKFFHCLLGAV